MLDPWYITGFCDGEAAFTYSRSGGSFGLYFSIRQREDNGAIIDSIRQYFNNIGNLYHCKEALPTKNSGHSKPAVYFRVTKTIDLYSVIQHFDKFPLQSSKKREAYETWRKMVIHKLKNYRRINYDVL